MQAQATNTTVLDERLTIQLGYSRSYASTALIAKAHSVKPVSPFVHVWIPVCFGGKKSCKTISTELCDLCPIQMDSEQVRVEYILYPD